MLIAVIEINILNVMFAVEKRAPQSYLKMKNRKRCPTFFETAPQCPSPHKSMPTGSHTLSSHSLAALP